MNITRETMVLKTKYIQKDIQKIHRNLIQKKNKAMIKMNKNKYNINLININIEKSIKEVQKFLNTSNTTLKINNNINIIK